MTDDERSKIIQFVEERVPFNRFLGIKVCWMGDGEAEMTIPSKPELTGDPFRPAVHGGVISALADMVGGLAVFATVGSSQIASTVDLRVDYLRPGDVNLDIFAKAKVIRAGNRVAATQTVLYQSDFNTPIATANAVYNLVNQNWKIHKPEDA
jgi:uncharacterized protein (TIGR00369 family)